MQIDILIDKLTDCLVERESGNVVDTEYTERITKSKRKSIPIGSLIGVQRRKKDILFTSCL